MPEAPRRVRPALGLLVAPALTAVGALVAPLLTPSEAAASALTFAGGAAAGLLPIALAAPATLGRRACVALGVSGVGLLGLAAAVAAPRPAIAAMLVNLALVSVAHSVGGSIGRRVAHPGHLLPACAVAAAADLLSVIHPSGPTHAIASSERALSLLAVGFPVAGTHAVAPTVGAGDLLFIALVLGVAAAHRLSLARVAAAAAAGLAVAGAIAAALEAPFARGLADRLQGTVPALVPVGAALVAGVPEARRLRPEDRRTAAIAVAAAAAVVAGVLLSPR
jgi:hypothetical protein